MLNTDSTHSFDKKFQERGNQLLDTVFSQNPQLRSRVSIKSPRQCKQREVVFSVQCDSDSELSEIINTLCHWMKQEDSEDHLEGLMLY